MEASKRKAVYWMMAAVGMWGAMIALGVLMPAEWDWSRWTYYDGLGCLIVLGCTGALLLAWYLFLRARDRRDRS